MSQMIEEILKECHKAKLPYETWINELSEQQQQHVKESATNLNGLSEREYKKLGFKRWDDEIDCLLLIPAWLFHLLPDGIQLTSISGKRVVKGQDEMDLDDYHGCIAYGIQKKIEKDIEIQKDGDIVKRVQIDEKLSEEIGQYETVFHYRIEKEVGAGIDHSTGETCEVYCQMKIQHTNPITEESYKLIHEKEYRQKLAIDGVCDPKYITPITKEEYEAEMNTDKVENSNV